MSIAVTQERPDVFTIQLHEPELSWVRETAGTYGMTKAAIVSAAFGHGITHYRSMTQRLTEQDIKNAKRANDLDEGTS